MWGVFLPFSNPYCILESQIVKHRSITLHHIRNIRNAENNYLLTVLSTGSSIQTLHSSLTDGSSKELAKSGPHDMMIRFPDATGRANDTPHQDEIYSSMNRINFSATVSGAQSTAPFSEAPSVITFLCVVTNCRLRRCN